MVYQHSHSAGIGTGRGKRSQNSATAGHNHTIREDGFVPTEREAFPRIPPADRPGLGPLPILSRVSQEMSSGTISLYCGL